jgi:hypothetical protein
VNRTQDTMRRRKLLSKLEHEANYEY